MERTHECTNDKGGVLACGDTFCRLCLENSINDSNLGPLSIVCYKCQNRPAREVKRIKIICSDEKQDAGKSYDFQSIYKGLEKTSSGSIPLPISKDGKAIAPALYHYLYNKELGSLLFSCVKAQEQEILFNCLKEIEGLEVKGKKVNTKKLMLMETDFKAGKNMDALASFIENTVNLNILKFKKCSFEDTFQTLVSSLDKNKSISILAVKKCHLNPKVLIEGCIKFLKRAVDKTELYLTWVHQADQHDKKTKNEIPIDLFKEFLEALKDSPIKKLGLEHCGLNDKHIEELKKIGTKEKFKELTHLSLKDNNITDVGAEHLSNFLAGRSMTMTVILEKNEIKNDGAAYFGPILHTLEKLNMKNNKFTGGFEESKMKTEGDEEKAHKPERKEQKEESKGEAYDPTETTRPLFAGNIEPIKEIPAQKLDRSISKGLQVLSISNNILDDKEYSLFINALKASNSVTKLYIANTGLKNKLKDLFLLFREPKQSSIARLDISHNDLNDEDVRAAFRAMISKGKATKENYEKTFFRNLIDLRMGMNALTDKGCVEIVKAIAKQERMESIDLSSNFIGYAGCKALIDLATIHKSLKKIKFHGNTYDGESEFLALSSEYQDKELTYGSKV